MIRAFETHKIRKQKELTGCLWDFSPCQGEKAGKNYKVLYKWVQNETEGAGKPFMITEIGAGGIYGYRHPSHVKWTEEYQSEALEKQIKAVLEYKDCIGIYIWQFCDVRISEEWFGGRPRTMNNKGIVDEYRRPKLSYEVVKKLFEQSKEKMKEVISWH